MTEYTWPELLRPSRLVFYLQHNTLRFVSPLTRTTQALRREGARSAPKARRPSRATPSPCSATTAPCATTRRAASSATGR